MMAHEYYDSSYNRYAMYVPQDATSPTQRSLTLLLACCGMDMPMDPHSLETVTFESIPLSLFHYAYPLYCLYCIRLTLSVCQSSCGQNYAGGILNRCRRFFEQFDARDGFGFAESTNAAVKGKCRG
jgi:hypothetical protein